MDRDSEAGPAGRRPLKSRKTAWAARSARWLCARGVSPNQISVASVVFALAAAASLAGLHWAEGWWRAVLPLVAAAGIQLRLLCNLMDGMVAVEGGKGTKSGELYNDIPDRVADAVIFVAAGFGAWGGEWAVILGWLAAVLAVMTAYVRTLAASIGAPVDFRGPMAKQHRMAVMTAACMGTALEWSWGWRGQLLLVALVVVAAGCVVTLWRRVGAAHAFLEGRGS